MLKKYLFAVLLLTSLAACKSKSAFDYSQDFVKKEKSLTVEINATEASVKRYFAASNFEKIAEAGERMEKLVDGKLKEIKDAPAPDAPEGENFKEAGIKYFTFIKSMYTGYKNFGKAGTLEAREEELNNLKDLVGKKANAIEDIQNAQRKFAQANKFKLEDK